MEKITPKHIKSKVAKKLNARLDDVSIIVNEYLKITNTLIQQAQQNPNQIIYIPHIGKFTMKQTKQKIANDFVNQTKINIPPRIQPKFTINQVLLKKFKKNWDKPQPLNIPINPNKTNTPTKNIQEARKYKKTYKHTQEE